MPFNSTNEKTKRTVSRVSPAHGCQGACRWEKPERSPWQVSAAGGIPYYGANMSGS